MIDKWIILSQLNNVSSGILSEKYFSFIEFLVKYPIPYDICSLCIIEDRNFVIKTLKVCMSLLALYGARVCEIHATSSSAFTTEGKTVQMWVFPEIHLS